MNLLEYFGLKRGDLKNIRFKPVSPVLIRMPIEGCGKVNSGLKERRFIFPKKESK